jgi:(p)ppGpp synthase/HD superfamily hydrolase
MQKRLSSQKILDTINLATRLHNGQTRRDEYDTPYISHLYSVALILSDYTDDEDMIMAGLMHDSLEDVKGYTYEQLVLDCGVRVADIVLGVTEDHSIRQTDSVSARDAYIDKKKIYLENLKSGSKEAVMVSVADKLHNLMSFHTLPIEHKHAGHTYVYNEVLKIGKDRLNNHKGETHLLVLELERVLSGF